MSNTIRLILKAATLFKKRLWHRFFLVNFIKFLGTTFFIEHIWATAFELSFVNPRKKQHIRNRFHYLRNLFWIFSVAISWNVLLET